MTIYKVNHQQKQTEKEILEKKLLAEVQAETEVEARQPVEVGVLAIRRRQSKLWLNIFLILVALLVLAAGITGGVLLYKRLSHKIYRGRCGFTAEWNELENDDTPIAMSQNDRAELGPDTTKKPKATTEHKDIKLNEDVRVIDDKVEIHMPTFRDFRDTMILHDFEKNYSAIVDYQLSACYVMKLDRSKVSPPKDWIDLIHKFASGYYMPKARVLRKKYHVITPAVKNTDIFGRYISAECLYFQTYRLEKMVGDHHLFKRSAILKSLHYSYVDGKNLQLIELM